nr:hypothetical protein [Escherichia coli]
MATSSAQKNLVRYGLYRNRQCAENATPGRDLCWLLTRHPEKPEYHVVLCVRQEYFDGPELDRLILDAWSTYWASRHGEAAPYQKQITRDVCWTVVHRLRRHPQRVDMAFSDFAPIVVVCAIRKPVTSR